MQFTKYTTRELLFHDPTRTSCTSRTGRGLQYTLQVSLMICNSPIERLVNYCYTTRTNRTGRTGHTGRGLQYILEVSLMIYNSPFERLVHHCFTTSTNRMSRTGCVKKTMTQYQSYQFVYIGQPSRMFDQHPSATENPYRCHHFQQRRGRKLVWTLLTFQTKSTCC